MNNELNDIFLELAKIPSPSLREDSVANKIIEILLSSNINAKKDTFGNVIAKIAPTSQMKKPLLLSAHMDVVGDDSPVVIQKSDDGRFFETDKKRTLGADDKAGVAAAIMLAKDVIKNTELSHGGLELVFTKDEEHDMSGIHHLQFGSLESEYVLVLDSDRLARLEISGASYTKLDLIVTTPKGGHSGLDIADKTRLNAAKLIAELICQIPQGVYKKDEYGVVTSINIGSIIGGGVESAISNLPANIPSNEYTDYIARNSMSNLINQRAQAHYSIRSSEEAAEQKLIEDIKNIAADFNRKYDGLARCEIEVSEHLKAFEKSNDEYLIETAKKASATTNIPLSIGSFHAGAETHIYANEKNKYGKIFKPVLLGVADIYNMHSPEEKIDIASYEKGYEFLKAMFEEFNS